MTKGVLLHLSPERYGPDLQSLGGFTAVTAESFESTLDHDLLYGDHGVVPTAQSRTKLTIESFGPSLGAFSAAVAIWRDIEPTPDSIAFEVVEFLRRTLASLG
jgi:hypothetical protein